MAKTRGRKKATRGRKKATPSGQAIDSADESGRPKRPKRRSKKPDAKPRKSKPAESKAAGVAHAGSYAVSFAGVTIGPDIATVGVRMDRDEMRLADADEAFCGRRITGSVTSSKNIKSETPVFPAMRDKDCVVRSIFDVKRLGINPTFYTFCLAFSLKEIDIGDLASFAKKTGMLDIDSVKDLAAKSDEEVDG